MASLTTYADAKDYLNRTQAWLEQEEAVNSLLLGLAFRLVQNPHAYGSSPPYLATVAGDEKLIVAALMTPPFRLVLYAAGQPPTKALDLVARDLLTGRWSVPGVLGPSDLAKEFATVWERLTGQTHVPGKSERVHQLRRVIHPQYSPGDLRPAVEGELELLAQWVLAFNQEAMGGGDAAEATAAARSQISRGDLYVWDNSGPVSMAAKNRPTTHGMTVNNVYTPPSLRGRGYASSCVARLSQFLLDSGWEYCALFTDLANPVSNKIYRRIGYEPVRDFQEYNFSKA